MFKKVRKFIPAVILFGALLSANSAFAASSGTITGGTLNFASNTDQNALTEGSNVTSSNSLVGFGSIGTVDVTEQFSTINTNDYLRIDDNRGTNEGWQIKVSASDLTANVEDKTTGKTGDTVQITLPIGSVLKANTASLSNIAGSMEGITSQTGATSLSPSGVALVTADKGYGAGAYSANVTYALSLPNYLPADATLTPSDATDSKFANVTDPTRIGMFAGDYSTTIQYAVTVAP
ncbi:hypothetical protein GCM10011391_02080 [Pullulanibacillus camelliae]|uniref:WxL domain-containing protein n=1 Tax=Pullulanibacillus camelliae TaxID=1707096 RepID=A0A8J2VJA1_9BACL|nr:WxL domain-containing protein [Pullulanibacillus camelliae]GGE27307.1 hypothetical protein GCM10011391_02080 [Pullulanibacillus camelliae]